jgi:aspartate kinase
MGKSTDALLAMGQHAFEGDLAKSLEILEGFRAAHLKALEGLSEQQEEARQKITDLLDHLESILTGVSLIKELSPRTRDTLLSFGELLSTRVIYFLALQRGLKVELLDSRNFISTGSQFGNAEVNMEKSYSNIRQGITLKAGTLKIAQGFIGSDSDSVTTTIGRGGSDYSASIYGAALNVEEIQIWTDVNGIMTCDPRIVPEARTIERIRYDEAAELAFFGAKVVHPSTIIPAVKAGIPVVVKNTRDPGGKSTVILEDTKHEGPLALAGKKGILLFNINSSRMLNAYGFLANLFTVFQNHKVPVDLVATSEVSVSMTVDAGTEVKDLLKDLEKLGEVTVERDLGIICLVGKDLYRSSDFISRTFKVLSKTPIHLISQGASEINLSLVVPATMLDNSIGELHREFFSA